MVYRAYIKILTVFLVIFMVEAAYASTVTITDKLGRNVTVQVPVKKAVVVITYELIPALNIWSQIVGVSRWAEESSGLYKAIIKENPSLKKPTVGAGTDINMEAVMKLNPDVVITWTYNPNIIRFLEERGIKVIGIYPESLTELYKDMRMQGRIFGKEKRIEEVIKEMEKIFKFIESRVSKIPFYKRKKVIHLGGSPTRVSGAFGVTNDIIKIAGAVNPAGSIMQRNVDVSVEKIIEWSPDVIFIWGSAGYNESWLYSNSQWRFINAVKNNKVYKLPKWSTWSPHLAPIALYMAMKIYPEEFKDVCFEKMADDFYKKVFGISYYKVRQYEES